MKSFPVDIVQRQGAPGVLPVDRDSSKAEREVFVGSRSLLKEVPMAGQIRYEVALQELPEHSHLESFEICYIRTGSLDWKVEKHYYHLKKGDLFFTIPGEFHGGRHAMMQPCELDFIQLNQRILSQESDAICSLNLKLLKELKFSSKKKWTASSMIGICFKGILNEFRDQDQRSVIQARLWISLLLGEILRLCDTEPRSIHKRNSSYSFQIKKAVQFLNEHWMESPSLKQLKKEVGLDESQLQRRFKKEVGCNPHDYIITKKMGEAKQRLLCEKVDITRIAHDLGFSSSQYFSTVFKKYFGLSPREFRKASKLDSVT